MCTGEELLHWAKSCRRCPTSQENCSWSHYRQGLLSFAHSLAHVSTLYVEQHSSFDNLGCQSSSTINGYICSRTFGLMKDSVTGESRCSSHSCG
jgi:hypothetical protein